MNDPLTDRTTDIFLKNEKVSAMLREIDRDGLLVLEPANFAWLTAGASAKGIADPAEHPALYLQGPQRWLLCSNVDTQRLFDEELDGLGFGLKEWTWHSGRGRLLSDLVHGKKAACDMPFNDCENVGERLRQPRRMLSAWEQERLRELGLAVAHAVEATCRNLERGDTEEETAGQLSHRLVHHGIQPLAIQVSADGRKRTYRRGGATPAKIEQTCVVQTTARRWGVHVTASRAICFGTPADDFRKEFDMACWVSAMQIASSTSRTKPGDILTTSSGVLRLGGFEHEWRYCPVGWLTGLSPVESMFTPTKSLEPLEVGHAVVWQASIGAAAATDTALVTETGPQIITAPAPGLWPVRRIKVASVWVDRPDLLVRGEPAG